MRKQFLYFALLSLLAPAVVNGQKVMPDKAYREARRAEMMMRRNTQLAAHQAKDILPGVAQKAIDYKPVELYGTMVSGDGDYYKGGTTPLYKFDNDRGNTNFTKVTNNNLFVNNDFNCAAGCYVEGVYYLLDHNNAGTASTLLAFDAENDFAKIGDGVNVSACARDLTYDPQTGNVYGFFTSDNFNTYHFGQLNIKTGEVTNIGDKCTCKSFIAAQLDGDIYTVDENSCMLQYVDKSTGALTDISNIFQSPSGYADGLIFFQSAVFNWEDGTLYWHDFDNAGESALFAIRLEGEGAQATVSSQELLKDYTWGDKGTMTCDQIVGLFIKQSAAVAGSPATASDLTASFSNGALTGTFSFTMPQTDTAGESLEGKTLGYEVTVGEEKKSGTASPGENVSLDFTFSEEGSYDFGVVVSDGAQKSLLVSKTYFIGHDTPATPSNIKFFVGTEGKRVSLIWDPVTIGANGGFVENVTYNVYRFPDNKQVAKDLAQSSFGEEMESDLITVYWYEIEAVAGGKTSARAQSVKNAVGSVFAIPYNETFDEAISLAGYAVADNNKDGVTWGYVAENNPEHIVRQCLCYPGFNQSDADDWLFTPGFQLEEGKVYNLSFTLRSNFDQTFSVWMGGDNQIDGMTQVLVPEQTYKGAYYVDTKYEVRVKHESAGKYHFGFHVTSPKDGSDFYLDNLSIESLPLTVPAAPADFTVTPGEKGALSAELSFTVPSSNLSGEAIESVSSVTIVRDEVEIFTKENVTPGEKITFTDESMRNGMHVYGAYAINADGMGDVASVARFIGLDAPCEVQNLKVVEDWKNNPGTIIATWDAPSEVGQNGGYVNPDNLVYYNLVAGNYGDEYLGNNRTCSAKIDISKGQTVDGFSIYAENSAGSGKQYRKVASCMVGPSIEMPVYESFPGVSCNSGPWSHTVIDGDWLDCNWYTYDGSVFESGTQDGDGGMMCYQATKSGNVSRLRSPKIDIRGAANPTFIFYLYLSGKKDYVDVEVSKEFGDYETVRKITMDESAKGWTRFEVPLKGYADCEFIQLGLAGHAVESTDQVIPLDNISIRDYITNDLEAGVLSAPREIKVGKTGTFTLTLANRGEEDIEAGTYSIELYKNDVKTATISGPAAPADRAITAQLTDIPTIDDSNPSYYKAKIVYTADKNEGNNESEAVAVRINMPLYPAADGLQAKEKGEGIELIWNEPDMALMQADPTVDDFESYNDFITSDIGPWKNIDRDGAIVKRISVDGMTNLPYPTGDPMAFIVYNPLAIGNDLNSWRPFSGNKMLVAFSASRKSGTTDEAPQSDDWFITPELNGMPQTVSFFVKAGHSAATEILNVGYSTTDDAPESFAAENMQQLKVTGTNVWQEVRISLPAGAKYFAINYASKDQLAVLIDDISYVPAGKMPEEVSLTGYNLYRDGEKIGEELGDTYYLDTDVTIDKSYTYKVTAVYDKGESVYSPEVSILRTGINEMSGRSIAISGGVGRIFISGAKGQIVNVFNSAGVEIFSTLADKHETVNATPGVYVVRVAGKAVKVSVR